MAKVSTAKNKRHNHSLALSLLKLTIIQHRIQFPNDVIKRGALGDVRRPAAIHQIRKAENKSCEVTTTRRLLFNPLRENLLDV